MPHLAIAGAVISNWKAGHAKGEQHMVQFHAEQCALMASCGFCRLPPPSHMCLPADPDVHALLWMAETIFDIIGMGSAIEAAQRAIKYVLATGATGTSKAKKTS